MRIPKDTIADREFLAVDPALAIAAGAWEGVRKVNKFGYAPHGVQTAGAWIWDRADATPTQSTWIAPTSSVVHNVKSTSVLDKVAGAKIVRAWGLVDWDSKETYEDITMNGTTNVPTTNPYVIIHRMSVISYGASGPNVGTITATTDDVSASVTAQINPDYGQTEMALYGIDSGTTAYLTSWYASIMKASGTVVDVRFELNFTQDISAGYGPIVKEVRGLQSSGASEATWPHNPYKTFTGPGIISIYATSSAADVDTAAGFNLILLDN